MTDLNKVFRAGRTMRWHTNADMSDTVDPLDGHQGRVARIILALWPDASRDLLIAALTHDDGESVTGDKPATHEKTAEEIEAEDQARAAIWGDLPDLSDLDKRRLKYADRLDAYMWVQHHKLSVLDADEWVGARAWLLSENFYLMKEASQ